MMASDATPNVNLEQALDGLSDVDDVVPVCDAPRQVGAEALPSSSDPTLKIVPFTKTNLTLECPPCVVDRPLMKLDWLVRCTPTDELESGVMQMVGYFLEQDTGLAHDTTSGCKKRRVLHAGGPSKKFEDFQQRRVLCTSG